MNNNKVDFSTGLHSIDKKRRERQDNAVRTITQFLYSLMNAGRSPPGRGGSCPCAGATLGAVDPVFRAIGNVIVT